MNLEQLSFLPCKEEHLKKFDIPVKDKKELVSLVNESIYRKYAKTTKEKFEVLDLRDKLLKLIRFEVGLLTNSNVVTLTGTCDDMCPEKERYSREYLSLCHRYEMVIDGAGETNYTNPHLMIKEYSRSSADQDLPLPNEMRPLLVLYDTMMYIIDDVISKIASIQVDNEFSFGDWYDFVWNRTRSIRKDIIQQRLLVNDNLINELKAYGSDSENYLVQNGLGGVILIEQCARFHILCAHRLCEQSTNDFDFKINEENLKNCFQSLRQYYEATSSKFRAESDLEPVLKPSPNESEFRSYIILLNLNESNILSEIQRWPEHIRHSNHVKFALKVYFAFNSRNYIRFFRLVNSSECQYLQACILHRYFFKMRCEAFKSIFTAFRENKEKIYPINKLVESLGFENDDEAYDYCTGFNLEVIDDVNVIMRSTSSVETCFKLSKSNEDSLKFRRSYLLVESKFEGKLNWPNNQLSAEQCLSAIISGQSYSDGTKKSSRFEGGNYELQNSFNEEGLFSTNEINELLVESLEKISSAPKLKTVKKTNKPKVEGVQATTSKTTASNKSILKTAKSLLKNAAQQSTKLKQGDLSLIKERRKSSSSASSTTSDTKSNKSPGDDDGFQGIKDKPHLEKKNKLFKPFSDLKQAQTAFGTKPVTQTSSLAASRFNPAQTKPLEPGSLFSKNKPSDTTNPFFGTNPSIIQRKLQPTGSTQFQTEKHKNFFADIITNQKPLQQQINEETQNLLGQQQKDIVLDSLSENIFQNFYLEVVKDTCSLFLFKEKILANEILAGAIEIVVGDLSRGVLNEELNIIREQRKIELMRQRENELNQQKQQIISILSADVYHTVLDSLIKEECKNCLMEHIYEDILLNLFQKEFANIIKEIANEMNKDMVLDKLAENVYLNWSEDTSEEINEPNTNQTLNSIYMNDLHSYLHQCVYEFTRLNLNVNREFYYEIKQALVLNQQMYIFRKWRLKLSIKLLTIAHRRASLTNKKPQPPSSDLTNRSSNAEISQQLNMISFMKSYGIYLLDNLSKLQKIISYLTPNSYYSYDFEHLSAAFDLNSDFNMIKLSNYSIVHCEQYQMYLTWNSNMNYKNYLYDLLLDNYFNIIRNKDNYLILPPPLYYNQQTISNQTQQFDNVAFSNTEIMIKMILAIPLLKKKRQEIDENGVESIKRWLMSKFFIFDSKNSSYETTHLENLCVNCLKSNKFGIKFCLKLCSNEMTQTDCQKKLTVRSLFGSNSMVFVLMPIISNMDISNLSDEEYEILFKEYLVKTRKNFHNILGLFNENLELNKDSNLINTYEFMFISYLDSNQQTKFAIDYILGINELDNYCYCLLDGDVVKDNGILQRTFQFFLQKICIKYSKLNFATHPDQMNILNPLRYEIINNLSSLSELFDMSCLKFIDFLCHHPIRNSIYIPFDCVLKEFNMRLRKLVNLLTKDVYKKISWPIPEMIDFETNSEMWTLRYWNTNECFENVIGKQFYDLLYLNEEMFELDKHGQNDLIEFNLIEINIFNYLNQLLANKINANKFPSQSECVKSIYHLESTIKTVLENMKKLCNLTNLNTSKNLFKIDKQNGNEHLSPSKLLIKKSNIEWSKLVLPIVDYLLANGFVLFREKKIYLNQFYIYFNLNEFKAYDWINNCVQPQLSPSSYAVQINESIESNYLVKKYPKQMEEYKIKPEINLKRRYSGDGSFNNLDKTGTESISESNGSISSKLESSTGSDSHNKQLKYQKLITSPLKTQLFEKSNELETKLDTFLSMLSREKENTNEFKNRLNKIVTNDEEQKKEDKVKDLSSQKIFNLDNESNLSENNNLKAISLDLDNFLEKLKQEKLKNEQFNTKLDKMLNY